MRTWGARCVPGGEFLEFYREIRELGVGGDRRIIKGVSGIRSGCSLSIALDRLHYAEIWTMPSWQNKV
jgi:hypothetical protein